MKITIEGQQIISAMLEIKEAMKIIDESHPLYLSLNSILAILKESLKSGIVQPETKKEIDEAVGERGMFSETSMELEMSLLSRMTLRMSHDLERLERLKTAKENALWLLRAMKQVEE